MGFVNCDYTFHINSYKSILFYFIIIIIYYQTYKKIDYRL